MMEILFTHHAGDEGARVLYERYQKALENRFSEAYLASVKHFSDRTDPALEIGIFERYGAIYRAVSDGGALRTLFELAETEKIGMTVDEDRIPIHQETVEICELFDGNPYAVKSDGCFVALTDRADEILRDLWDLDIPAVVIGHTEKGCRKTLYRSGEPQCMNRPKKDWLFKTAELDSMAKELEQMK